MWPIILLGLLIACLVGWLVTWLQQRSRIRQLELSKEEIQIEETLVFDFLHGLGEAFSETIRAADLHRLIVEGAARVLDAHGGALYMMERAGGKLAPAYISRGCPPFVEVPADVLQKAATIPAALENYLNLHTIPPGVGLVGRVWQTREAVCLTDLANAPELAHLRGTSFGATSVMVTPLLYAKQNMGVLVLANGPMSTAFTQSDFVVFKSIAEQSAFALYNAIIYSEANEKKRLDHDLEIAQDIQRLLLPSEAPVINGFEISGINIPARHVSGDYFDYIKVDDDRLGVAIADVSGKGVPASIIMAICRSVLRSQAAGNPSPGDVLQKVNRQIYPDIKEDMFISMAYVILDHVRNTMLLSRAGHDAPLLYQRASESVTPIKPLGMVVGIDSGSVFDRITSDFALSLERDDCLLLYTDGVTEALDAKGDEFGFDRVVQCVRDSAPSGAPAIITRLIDELRSFVGTQPQNDDITLIAIRKT
ncbi:MAG TPA: GAF domain-containing SpoIIE family protein phosphatase [Chthoniobacterales bacterium]|jgi:sigma-B regulation protein RsbU (phosphoserine phosphatase)|nr:GAF domain-containing SpoIIE family protein phosphatase [Chthoniobacterales bacterium]